MLLTTLIPQFTTAINFENAFFPTQGGRGSLYRNRPVRRGTNSRIGQAPAGHGGIVPPHGTYHNR